jgi:fructokinase
MLGIETGGTTIRVAVADTPTRPLRLETLPTAHPATTLPRLTRVVGDLVAGRQVEAVGIAAFGPIDVDPGSPTYGVIGASPKADWSGVDLREVARRAVDAPVVIDTDVTAAAIAERQFGAGGGAPDVCYVTVGTGVGVGAVVEGHPLHGTAHPELGHLLVRRHPDDSFGGVCRFHGDCLEGLASAPALTRRWTVSPELLSHDLDAARRLETYYLAQLVVALTYILSPTVVVIGGGVAAMPGLLPATAAQASRLVGGALGDHAARDPGSGYVTASRLGGQAGIIGALALADGCRNRS